MYHRRPTALTPTSLLCCALSYALLLSALLPFVPRRVEAASGASKKAAAAAVRQGVDAPRREGELLVRFREGVAEESKGALVSSRGGRRKAKLRGESRLEKVEVLQGQDPAAAAEALRLDPAVELAEPNFLVTRAQAVPDDARFGEQWALHNAGQAGGAEGSDVRVTSAWQQTTGAATTVVAVLDSGVDFTHPDLSKQQWVNRGERPGDGRDDDRNGFVDDAGGWDWVTDSGAIRDEQGHGTSVAGLIAAEGNNLAGVTGVMWRASLMSLRVLDATGTGDVAAAVEAIDYAAAHGASVVNCSWGTAGESQALKDAIERAGRRGVVVVASAGNSAQDIDAAPYYPASFDLPNLVAVASTDRFDNLAQFSNWGATRVGVAAPGVELLTTKMGGDYWMVAGTSASAPLVSGIAGLLKTVRPQASGAAVRQALHDGARRVNSLAGKVSSGGVASAWGALAALQGSSIPPGNGQGNGQGNGSGNGNGNGGQHPQPPNPGRGSGGNGPGGSFDSPAAEPTAGALPGLPNLDAIADQPSYVAAERPPAIRSNLAPLCDDCFEAGGSDSEFSTARTRPENETGTPGEDLGSRNFSWATPLVNLPGRAGLDLNLALAYNSLVWTRQGNQIQYNADAGYPAPGFRLGFPTLQDKYFDTDEGVWSYMMATPSGGRVQMRYVGLTAEGYGIYDSSDGSYTRLIDYVAGGAVVLTSDGTRYTFFNIPGGEKRCSQIKDRNGNFITVAYNASNKVSSVTDTLGRVITFNYTAEGNLDTLTQIRSGMLNQLIKFEHGTQFVMPNFAGSGLDILGPYNQYISVLSRVILTDGSRYEFAYTTFGQVWKIEHYAPDGVTLLSRTGYDVSDSAWRANTPQTDCPRYTQRRDWIRMGVMNADAELITNYAVATDGSWSQVTLPDGRTRQKEYFATAGWQRGLTTRSEVIYDGVVKKWTTTSWTQDNESLSYQKNPRPTQVNVEDPDGNLRRTVVNYATASGITLPSEVQEHGKVNGVLTLLRRTTTEYRWDAAFIDRRIIGLPERVQVYAGAGPLLSKTTYSYDWNFGGDMFQDTPAAATQHDRTSYGPSFVFGRGNLSQMARYDVNDPSNAADTWQETKWRHNSTGSVLMLRDHLWHATYFDYADSFSDKVGRNTFAYPTRVTDGDGYQSTTRYKFETGAVTQSSRPSSGTTAAANVTYEAVALTYDTYGRLETVDNQNPEASDVRYVYPGHMGYLQQFRTLVAGQGELRSEEHYDGVGRVRATSAQFPGSAGGYRATHVMWDVMGRVVQSVKPMEINASWAPTGPDAAAGWVWTLQTYDWKGRPLLTTNPDNSTREFTYGGCGCAGGEVVTARDERGRRRKLYHDGFGRLSKVEELNWNQSVYSTAVYTYDALDRLTRVDHDGQERLIHYDGRGRVWKRTTPEQGQVEYSYLKDDTLAWFKDARGARTVLAYGNNRHLPTGVSYDLSGVIAGQNVAATAGVTFAYDAAGSRTQMADGLGTVNYSYDALSRLRWEERTFTGLGGPYRLSYTYGLAGQLASVTNHMGSSVAYGQDAAGQVTQMTGSGLVSAANYAQGVQYRAWGAVRQASYGDGRQLSVDYDERMRVKSWDVPGVMGWEYNYDSFGEKTGRVTYARNKYDPTLDRSYDYDAQGRLIAAHTASSARTHVGLASTWGTEGPYAHGYAYDKRGNLTLRDGWGGEGTPYASTYATNNQRVGYHYDAAGNTTSDGWTSYAYDAEGRQVGTSYSGYSLAQSYDGDRLRVKKVEQGITTFYLRSSVLGGQIVAELNGAGTWMRGYVYDWSGDLLAMQYNGAVSWYHQDPVVKSRRVVSAAGATTSAVELDPWGAATSRMVNSGQQPRLFTSYLRDGVGSDDAQNRRYNRYYARFEQPDPADSSYDLADPQSFNRYSYTQNDPVNFTDPSGLNLEATGGGGWSCSGTWSALRQPDGTITDFRITSINCVSWGSSSGGALGGVTPEGQDDKGPLPFNNCEQFVSYLVGLAQGAVDSFDRGDYITAHDSANFLGASMMKLSYKGYERYIHNKSEDFKPALTANGQNAGVYGHILGQAGAMLDVGTGTVIGIHADMFDRAQRLWGTEQGASEVEGNKAGWAVGMLMYAFITGSKPRDGDGLFNNIKKQLCD